MGAVIFWEWGIGILFGDVLGGGGGGVKIKKPLGQGGFAGSYISSGIWREGGGQMCSIGFCFH